MTYTVTDDTLKRLLALELQHDTKIHTIEEITGSEHALDNLRIDVLDIVLDIMGVPADNTVETCACERANATGVWPEDAFCRDWLTEKWAAVSLESNPNLQKFLDWVRKESIEWEGK